MRPIRTLMAAALAAAAVSAQSPTGELRLWHKITWTFDGPALDEIGPVNPFTDYRLDVFFTDPNGRQVVVPGYYAADGDAAETSASTGTKWRVHLNPDVVGTWTWWANFKTGPLVAIQGGGTATDFHGATGSVDVLPSDKTLPDFRARGLLRSHEGQRFPRFAGTDEPFLEVGTNSPENVLAYVDFDGTTDRAGEIAGFLHEFQPHVVDFARLGGGPTWQNGKGQGLLGALNYLGEQRMNSMFLLSFTGWGDGDDVWPWVAVDDPWHYDCSKLDQWQRVLEHAMQKGIHVQFTLSETENESFFEIFEASTSNFADSRKLYHRELIARFGHLNGITWNLGEEMGWDPGRTSPYRFPTTDAQRRAFSAHLRALDPYDHPIIVHSYHNDRNGQGQGGVLGPLVDPNNPALDIDGASLQGPNDSHNSVLVPSDDRTKNNHANVRYWVEKSILADHEWSVGMHEQMPSIWGTVTDGFQRDPHHDLTRKDVLWGTWMAGGTSVQHYFGYGFRGSSGDDLNAESFYTRANLWEQSRVALDFFEDHLPYDEMLCHDELVADPMAYCLAAPGRIYAVYLREGGSTTLDLGPWRTEFDVRWFDPRTGGALQIGAVQSVTGPGVVSLGAPPLEVTKDWVALVVDTGRIPGSGCPAGTYPSRVGEPLLGEAFTVSIPDLGASRIATIAVGLPQAIPIPIPPPIACGASPCLLVVDTLLGAPGTSVPMTVPSDPGLIGAPLWFQGAYLDTGAFCADLTGAIQVVIRD